MAQVILRNKLILVKEKGICTKIFRKKDLFLVKEGTEGTILVYLSKPGSTTSFALEMTVEDFWKQVG